MYNFSIIIPSCGRDSLIKCLKKVQKAIQRIDYVKFQIIVSDDDASEKTKSKVENLQLNIEYIIGPGRGPAANRNNGAAIAKGEWLIFTDDDCLPDKNWLRAFIKKIIDEDKTIGYEGQILPLGNLEADMAECPVNTIGGCFWSANIAIKRNIFEKINGFDENFPIAAFEDIDIFIRLQREGNIQFIKEAIVYHPVLVNSIWNNLLKVPKRLKSWVYLRQKHTCFHNTTLQEIKRMTLDHLRNISKNLNKKKFCAVTILRLIVSPFLFLYYKNANSPNE